MSITRIAFNDTATYSGAYYLILNPAKLELNDSDGATQINILDGSPVKQDPYLDSRPIVLQWSGIRADYTGFSTMLGVLNGYKNANKYVNYGTADYSISATATWTYVRVMDLKVGVEKGGRLKYNVELILTKDTP